ncbi:MAG: hypothetical protein IE931_08800 [Sphingobacteriales bacterium]|nr:hypothetical protein [Sphingobacteriales bacterium]
MTFTGEKAIQILKQNLENTNNHICNGFFFEKNVWIAFDNYSKDCWVEEFHTKEMAICWIERFFEISEKKDFFCLKISDDLIFIPGEGYLNYFLNDDDICSAKFYPISQYYN